MSLSNFGRNVTFTPRHVYTPHTEEDVVDILNTHARGTVRVMGSLHAWNDAAVSDDAVITLKHLNTVTVEADDKGDIWVTAQGGCVLKKLIETIHARTDATIPTLGGMMRQTIAGALATGTHGSGMSSLSHYIQRIRIADYDSTGKATITEYTTGDGLRAARCSLGCMGVVLSVTFRAVPRYWIEETMRTYPSLEAVMAQESTYPLQQYMLLPYRWTYVAHHRRMKLQPPSWMQRLKAAVHRCLDYMFVEMVAHMILKAVLIFSRHGQPTRIIPWFYTHIVSNLMVGATVTNVSTVGLTLHTAHHATFRHLEMELFIPEDQLHDALTTIQTLTRYFAGEEVVLLDSELSHTLAPYQGSYMHHYPFFIRSVLPDDTLISMTAGMKRYYAVGIFTYLSERNRDPFYTFARTLAQVVVRRYQARLHWGKYFPLSYGTIQHLFPDMPTFHEWCHQSDLHGVFHNAYTKRVLGL